MGFMRNVNFKIYILIISGLIKIIHTEKMKKLAPRSPLSKIEDIENYSAPIEQTKRKLKIYTQKLPCGFFSESRNTECLREPSTARSKIKMYENAHKLP